MDEEALKRSLDGTGLAAWRYLEQVDSTNSEAARWLEAGAPDSCLVVANHQLAGRGRFSRRWHTPPDAALAMSLILKVPSDNAGNGFENPAALQLLTGLGAVALAEVLDGLYGLQAQIKWPNDVLVESRKIAGILVEAHWLGSQLDGVVIGIGVNILKRSIPPAETLLFPAASLEECLQSMLPDRLAILRSLVVKLLAWLPHIDTAEFLNAWETRLAWRGERVQVFRMADDSESSSTVQGRLTGLDASGRLILLSDAGETVLVEAGDLRLRPAG